MVLMFLQLLIVLGALWVGSRYGSLALGAISGIGLALLVFGFGMKPGSPPTDVIYIIIAAVTCAGIMQASGWYGLVDPDCREVAEKASRPHYIPGTTDNLLPDSACRYWSRGLHTDAYHL